MKYFLIVVLSVFSGLSAAEELVLEYKSFYSHVRKLNSEDTNKLQFAFGLRHIERQTMCEITEARISTDKKQIPINITSENRFTVPLERALNMVNAKVILQLNDAANKCDMSVQLETIPELVKNAYSQQELTELFNQYAIFFEDMGGFLSFMMPSVSGLVIHFDDLNYEKLKSGHEIINGRLELSEQDIKDLVTIEFTETPLRITALTQSS
ncbi:DUF2987 domain-containing protein [Glaciecola sp. 1036]|uniref:DUF2987 domain-containing protein n=1 Tax=Alteromonadaceae TaxID=72275 RepID=UPI003D02186A